jgi:hypothetical protein
MIDRRLLLGGLAAAGAAFGASTANAASQKDAPKPSLNDKLIEGAKQNRMAVAYDGKSFSGPGWDLIRTEGEAAQFFLVGEEHGCAEVPALVRETLLALKPSGYEHLALEISPPIAAELDRAALGGIDGLKRFHTENPPGTAFYTMKEEAQMLAAVRDAFPGDAQLLWGLDYEIAQDRLLIAKLKAKAPAAAKDAVAALESASAASWRRYDETHDIQFIFSFAGNPALVAAVRAAWPKPDPESLWILDTLEGTLEANNLYVEGKYFASNVRRAELNRANFVRYWREAKARGKTPKTMFKMGGNHMVRGRSMTECYDVGNLVGETAALEGAKSFHLFVGPPNTSQHAQLDPATFRYGSVPAETFDEVGVGFLAAQALPADFTLIDLRPLRPLMPGSVTRTADANLSRLVHGYDAMLILTGSKPSTNLF